jgi:AbrB family looped-hinge helix DNA binding protein
MNNVKRLQVKVSSKYQVVIPLSIRRQLQIKPGDYIKMEIKNNKLIAQKSSVSKLIDDYYGSMQGAWGPDPVAYIRKSRNEQWD